MHRQQYGVNERTSAGEGTYEEAAPVRNFTSDPNDSSCAQSCDDVNIYSNCDDDTPQEEYPTNGASRNNGVPVFGQADAAMQPITNPQLTFVQPQINITQPEVPADATETKIMRKTRERIKRQAETWNERLRNLALKPGGNGTERVKKSENGRPSISEKLTDSFTKLFSKPERDAETGSNSGSRARSTSTTMTSSASTEKMHQGQYQDNEYPDADDDDAAWSDTEFDVITDDIYANSDEIAAQETGSRQFDDDGSWSASSTNLSCPESFNGDQVALTGFASVRDDPDIYANDIPGDDDDQPSLPPPRPPSLAAGTRASPASQRSSHSTLEPLDSESSSADSWQPPLPKRPSSHLVLAAERNAKPFKTTARGSWTVPQNWQGDKNGNRENNNNNNDHTYADDSDDDNGSYEEPVSVHNDDDDEGAPPLYCDPDEIRCIAQRPKMPRVEAVSNTVVKEGDKSSPAKVGINKNVLSAVRNKLKPKSKLRHDDEEPLRSTDETLDDPGDSRSGGSSRSSMPDRPQSVDDLRKKLEASSIQLGRKATPTTKIAHAVPWSRAQQTTTDTVSVKSATAASPGVSGRHELSVPDELRVSVVGVPSSSSLSIGRKSLLPSVAEVFSTSSSRDRSNSQQPSRGRASCDIVTSASSPGSSRRNFALEIFSNEPSQVQPSQTSSDRRSFQATTIRPNIPPPAAPATPPVPSRTGRGSVVIDTSVSHPTAEEHAVLDRRITVGMTVGMSGSVTSVTSPKPLIGVSSKPTGVAGVIFPPSGRPRSESNPLQKSSLPGRESRPLPELPSSLCMDDRTEHNTSKTFTDDVTLRCSTSGSTSDVNKPVLSRKPSEDKLMSSYPWYFGCIDRMEAERKILTVAQDGVFVVRQSQRGGSDNPYALSVYYDGNVYNLLIRRKPDLKFALGSEKVDEAVFGSVAELVSFHQNNAIQFTGDNKKTLKPGRVLLLSSPSK